MTTGNKRLKSRAGNAQAAARGKDNDEKYKEVETFSSYSTKKRVVLEYVFREIDSLTALYIHFVLQIESKIGLITLTQLDFYQKIILILMNIMLTFLPSPINNFLITILFLLQTPINPITQKILFYYINFCL